MISTATAYDLIHKALRCVGVVGLGDTVDNLVAEEALLILNGMRAEVSLNVKNYHRYEQTYTAATNKQSITLGAGGDIAQRPNDIESIVIINGLPNGANNNFPVEIRPFTDYRSITIQNIYAIPQAAYIDNEYPLTNVFFYPGLSSGWSVRIMGSAYMTDYENVSDPFIDPPEYFDPLYLNLALRLAPLYGAAVPEGVVQQAQAAWKHIKAHYVKDRLGVMANGLRTSGSGVNFMSGLAS